METTTMTMFVTNIDANTDARYSGCCLIRSGPTCTPWITRAVIMMAAALPPGIPSERRGTMAPPVAPLLAASDATIPSGIPVPRSSGCFETFFSIAYARKEAMVAPAPGRIPTTVPIIDARIIDHFVSQSSLNEGSFADVSPPFAVAISANFCPQSKKLTVMLLQICLAMNLQMHYKPPTININRHSCKAKQSNFNTHTKAEKIPRISSFTAHALQKSLKVIHNI